MSVRESLRHYVRKALDLEPGPRTREDIAYDLAELSDLYRRDWGQRMRIVKSFGDPTAGLGFAGTAVPNSEPVAATAAVTTTTATASLYTLASSGASTWMWIPPGNFRAPQFWRAYAAGTATTTTSSTVGWDTRIGVTQINAGVANTNALLAQTGALTSGFNGTVNWWYDCMMTVRTPGTGGTAVGTMGVSMSNNAAGSATNAVEGLGAVAAGITLDCTQGAFWCIDITNSVTTNSLALTQMAIIAFD